MRSYSRRHWKTKFRDVKFCKLDSCVGNAAIAFDNSDALRMREGHWRAGPLSPGASHANAARPGRREYRGGVRQGSAGAPAVSGSNPPTPWIAPPAMIVRPHRGRLCLSRLRLGAGSSRTACIGPGLASPRHTHPGEEIIYVLEGALEYTVGGKPPVTLKAGDVLFIRAGAIHAAGNVAAVNAVELATYIVEKGKPLLVQVVDVSRQLPLVPFVAPRQRRMVVSLRPSSAASSATEAVLAWM
jgi:quercetin dioxygenase-like cupin family protein